MMMTTTTSFYCCRVVLSVCTIALHLLWNVYFTCQHILILTCPKVLNVNAFPLCCLCKVLSMVQAPCGLRCCKNGPAPFPGRISYKATKPCLVSVSYLSMFFIVLVFIRAPFYVLLVFTVCVLSFGCSS